MHTAFSHSDTINLDEILFREGPGGKIYTILEKISAADANLLIWGESGTGKNLFAYLAHCLGPRKYGPFLEISCSALPESLVETELFGYARGAFTGAAESHDGRLIKANEGTLVLDELDSLSQFSQAKLLRVVETGCFTPIGSQTEAALDLRVIGLTQENPEILVKKGILRKDLYYRLSLFSIGLPRLREYSREFIQLIDFFITQEAARLKKPSIRLSSEVERTLRKYPFPGNFRELQNLIRRWTLLQTGQVIKADDVPDHITDHISASSWKTLKELEKEYIRQVLDFTKGKKSKTAEILGIHRKTLLEKRKLYDLD